MNNKLTALFAAAMAGCVTENVYQCQQPPKPLPPIRFINIPKAVDSRQLREFSIKGHKIMAYSRKDAITRLKHQKKI